MIDKVVLINSVSYDDNSFKSYGFVSEAEQNLGLKTIKEALETAGFHNTVLVPSQPLIVSKSVDCDTFKEELIRAAGSAKNPAFGISTTTDHYLKVEPIARMIRKHFPRSKIILGGPHFARENLVRSDGTSYRDPIHVSLEEKLTIPSEDIPLKSYLADGVVVGHAQPFVDFVVGHQGDLEKTISRGFYKRNARGKIVGKGRGLFPKVGHLQYTGGGKEIGMMVRDSCGNRCDFCSIPGGISPDINLAKKSLEDAFENTGGRKLILYDSNPFKNGIDFFYTALFDYIDSAYKKPIYKGAYLDPASIAREDYFYKLLDFFADHHFYCFNMGRDAVAYHNAEFMGSRIDGEIRSQKQLDSEKDAIKRFIGELTKIRKRSQPRYEVIIHYIMTPIETIESATAMIDEIDKFHRMSNANVKVEIKVFALAPEPGTEVKRRHIDHILHPEAYELHNTCTNDWSYDIGPASYLLDVAPIIMGSDELQHHQKIGALRKAVREIFSGNVRPIDKSEPEGYTIELATNPFGFIKHYLLHK